MELFNYKTNTKNRGDRMTRKWNKDIDPQYISYYKRAESKKLPFELSTEEFIELRDSKCEYCGQIKAKGIDRINSSLGYIKSNCLPCCTKCNMMKYTYSKKEFISHVGKIFNHYAIKSHQGTTYLPDYQFAQ